MGQSIISEMRLREGYRNEVDWNTEHHEEPLELDEKNLPDVHISYATFDALNRLVFKRQSDNSIHQYDYHQSGLLRLVQTKISEEDEFEESVQNIDYNSKGQIISILYGNGTKTTYGYEKDTFRLETSKTRRSTDSSNKLIQDIAYIYDPVGNITELTDNGHRVVFNSGEIIRPTCKYKYDNLYRLKHAEGRQHSAIMPDDYKNPNAFKQSRFYLSTP